MDICTPEGTIDRGTIAKSHNDEGGYRASGKTKWGDLWRFDKGIPHKFRKEKLYGKGLW